MVLVENGERLPAISEYTEWLLPKEVAADGLEWNQYGAYAGPDTDTVLVVQSSPGHYRFMPGPEFSPRLYRGQTSFYDFCQPTCFRKHSPPPLFTVLKLRELGFILAQHPAVHAICSYSIEGLSFDLDVESIGQHYGYATSFLDFSRSKEVALFFATCKKNCTTGRYEPLKSGTSVIYTAYLKELVQERGDRAFLPLGFEPLPRPYEQKAMAVRLRVGENLNEMPWVKCDRLDITLDISQRYFDMFDGGDKLFSPHPFEKVIDNHTASRSICRSTISFAAGQNALPEAMTAKDVEDALLTAGFRLADDDNSIVVNERILREANLHWQALAAEFFSKIRFRGVCSHLSG